MQNRDRRKQIHVSIQKLRAETKEKEKGASDLLSSQAIIYAGIAYIVHKPS